MGLKRNISIPFGYFYTTNNPRFHYIRNINSKSWFNYSFLIKSSLYSNWLSHYDMPNNHLFFGFSSGNSLLSDFCVRSRKDPSMFRPQRTSMHGLDLSVSNYNFKFYYYDLKQRAQFF